MNRLPALLATAAFALLALPAPAGASPLIHLDSVADTTVAPGGQLNYHLSVSNVGDEATSGDLTVAVTMPAGLTAVAASEFPEESVWDCSALLVSGTCTFTGALTPNENPDAFHSRSNFLRITAQAGPAVSGVVVPRFDLYGGGAVRADGSPCDSSPPGTPCATAPDPTLVSASPPAFGIDAFDARASTGPAGDPSIEAGGHPYDYTTSIDFNTYTDPNPQLGDAFPVEAARDVLVDLPPGFIGNPLATGAARCTAAQLAVLGPPICPVASQVGATTIFSGEEKVGDPLPIFNMVPPPGVPARFGFAAFGSIVVLDASLRSGGDYGITVASRNISEGLALSGTRVTFWGVPADPVHDLDRSCPGEAEPGFGGPSVAHPPGGDPANCPYTRPPLKAFFRNPTSCGGPTTTTLHTDSWPNPGVFHSASIQSHDAPGSPFAPSEWGAPVGITDCEQVPFEPEITFAPTSNAADSPTGLDFDLTMPQEALSDPDAIAQADVKDAVVKLPVGMSVNPAAANGLGACTQAQIDLHSAANPTCPDNSKLGTVEIVTPLQEEPLTGSIYQAAQNDNPFNSTLAYYTVAKGEGFSIKLAALVRTNPDTGRLENVFLDNPQLPFDHYRLHFNSGPRAALVNPQTCGTKITEATFTPWSGNAPAQVSSSYQVTSGPNGAPCVGTEGELPFHPGFEAGLTSPIAGSSSPFVTKLSRGDGEQLLASIRVSPPQGLLGHLGGIPYCPEAQATSGECPSASQLGTSTSSAGAGPIPLPVDGGRVYLAGPYKGAPLSLVIVTPGKAGPFDLGDVVVRAAVYVDPTTAGLNVVSDPLPLSIQGVALHLRQVYVAIDRPGFVVTPTNCDPMAVDATIAGAAGASADLSDRFQVGECNRLAFKPKLTLRLKGKTKRSGTPALRATLTMPTKGNNANIARAAVTLPHSEFLDQAHIRTICTRVQYAAGGGGGEQCPKGSVYGHARAFTPLLDKPLEGPVYLRSSSHTLPDLVASLGGQIHIDLVGRIDAPHGGIRNTFELVPDAPVSKFVLTMQGGSKGLLENSTNLCLHRHRATALFDGQNGKIGDSRPVVKADCGKRRKGKS